ncbi:hypothetical protein MMC09_005473 [Bachmanniomyces sp. S44760]|nr:hypothetical protein [Bachmanniomyces sp. S44760]
MRPRNMQGIYDPSGNGTASAGTAGTAGSSQTATLTSALALPTNGAEPSANSNQKPTVTVVTTPSSSATSSSSSSSSTIPAKPTAAPYKDQPGQCTFDLTQITGGNAVDPASSVTGNLTMADVSGTQIGKLDPTPYTMTTQANMSSLLENYLIIMSWVADNGNGFLGAQFVLGQATWNTDQTDTSKPQSCDNSSSFVSLNDHTGSRLQVQIQLPMGRW